ncbi:DIS3-like exonuclease 2 [Cichlidogyrus casuarinus]|uniref:DIS3-like exonuclease 2 n=1 Tax=Cichlidogyrus casuarinus TaxID=1844966 RepID=A0ABD2Q4D9_9PLAT
MLVLLNMLTKTMNPAEYICMCGADPDDFYTHHYALNMRFYTHFTSPIRRFADVIVHRQLAKTLMEDAVQENKYELAEWWASTTYKDVKIEQLKSWADNCNVRRTEAREASEESADLFYTLFIKSLESTTELCSVVGVLDQSIDVLILSNGIRKRVYLKELGLVSYDHVPSDLTDESKNVVASIGKLFLQWKRPEPSQTENTYQVQCGCFSTEVQLFSVFRCIVSVHESHNIDNNKDPLEMPRLKVIFYFEKITSFV